MLFTIHELLNSVRTVKEFHSLHSQIQGKSRSGKVRIHEEEEEEEEGKKKE